MFTRTRKNARNKEYSSLFMKVQGVHRVIVGSLSLFLVISMNSFKLKNLGSRSEFAQTIVWRQRRGSWGKSMLVWSNQRFGHPSLVPISPVLQLVGSSMLCNMLGERSCMSLQMVSLKDLLHTYSCTCFYSKGTQYKQGLYQF